MSSRASVAALLALACLAIASLALAHAPPQTGDVLLGPGTIQHFGRAYDVEFGSLWVPMNRGDPASGVIELRFIRYKSTAQLPAAPLVFLAGGPGGSGIATMQSPRGRAFLAMLDERDFIAFDQRGTGSSEPTNLDFDLDLEMPLDEPGDREREAAAARDASARMLAAMRDRGIDVRGLTTEESADDLDALRVALGAEKLVLWGSSYGTHLALAAVRRHGDSIAAVILAGTEGPDHTFKLPSNIETNLQRLGAIVAQDPTYAVKMPDLAVTVRRVLDDLERNPRTVTLVPGIHVTIGAWDLRTALSTPMGSRGGLQQLPARLYMMAHGDFSHLARWAYRHRRPDRLSAMSVVMDCASYGSAERLALIDEETDRTLLGAAIDHPFPCLCEVEGMPRLPDAFRAPIHSDVPALFISGTLDGRTPVSNAQEVARGFTNHQHVVIRGATHGDDLFSTPAIRERVRAFLAGDTIEEPVIDGPAWTLEPPYERSLVGDMFEALDRGGYDAAHERYAAIRADPDATIVYDLREDVLDEAGAAMIDAGMIDVAVDLYQLNTVGWPESANAWDSLAMALMRRGDADAAIAACERSLRLNPESANAAWMLEELRGR